MKSHIISFRLLAIEGSSSMSVTFKGLIYQKGIGLMYLFPLNINMYEVVALFH